MTHAPLHGTSDRLNTQWIEKWVYFAFELSQMPLVPMDTNPQDCLRAEVNTDSFRISVCYGVSQFFSIKVPQT